MKFGLLGASICLYGVFRASVGCLLEVYLKYLASESLSLQN